MKCVAFIPARKGSKGLPGKNKKDFCGKPLVQWSIDQAKESKLFDKIILSSDGGFTNSEGNTVPPTDGNTIVAKPNNSLTPRGIVWLFISIVLIVSTVALGVSLSGAWLVLPFAGFEVLAFAYALHHIRLHYGDYESVSLVGNEVVVEKHGYKNSEKFTFQRYWARVTLRDSMDGTCGIFIGSHGKEIEFGSRYMDNEQRITVARKLKQQLNSSK
jgi:uncharacterized membrane protein